MPISDDDKKSELIQKKIDRLLTQVVAYGQTTKEHVRRVISDKSLQPHTRLALQQVIELSNLSGKTLTQLDAQRKFLSQLSATKKWVLNRIPMKGGSDNFPNKPTAGERHYRSDLGRWYFYDDILGSWFSDMDVVVDYEYNPAAVLDTYFQVCGSGIAGTPLPEASGIFITPEPMAVIGYTWNTDPQSHGAHEFSVFEGGSASEGSELMSFPISIDDQLGKASGANRIFVPVAGSKHIRIKWTAADVVAPCLRTRISLLLKYL
jgi:hypothetical protein